MRKILIFGLTISFWLLLSSQVEAAILNKTLTREYDFAADSVSVSETMTAEITTSQYLVAAGSEELFVALNPLLDDPNAKAKIDQILPTIRATDANGQPVKFRTEIKDQNILIYVAYPQNIRLGSKQTLKVTYSTPALATQTGAVFDFYIPSYSKDFKFVDGNSELFVNTLVRIPQQFGEINFVTPEVGIVEEGTTRRLTFTREQLTGKVAWVQIGTKQFYEFNIVQPYNSSSSSGFYHNTYEVLLPRDIQSGPITQTVFFQELSPSPTSVYTDDNGNLVGRFQIPADQSGSITVRGYAEVSVNKKFDIENSGNLSETPESILSTNIKAAEFWEANASSIKQKADELKGDDENVYKLLQNTYQFVVSQIDYSDVKRFGINERQGAVKTLAGGAAVCMEYSDLFIALMRAQGVPARAAFGYGYDSRSTNGVDTPHQWAEVYLPKQQTWILVDTTWGETGTPVIGADLNHFYKYVASDSPLQPAPVQVKYIGSLDKVPTESFTIKATATKPEFAAQSVADLLQRFPAVEPSLGQQINETATLILASLDAAASRLLLNLGLGASAQSFAKLAAAVIIVIVIVAAAALLVRRLRKQRQFKLNVAVNAPAT